MKKRIKNKLELIENDNKLNNYFENNPDSKKQYDINRKMIDFNNIPNEFVIKVIDKFKVIYHNCSINL